MGIALGLIGLTLLVVVIRCVALIIEAFVATPGTVTGSASDDEAYNPFSF